MMHGTYVKLINEKDTNSSQIHPSVYTCIVTFGNDSKRAD